MEEKYNKTLWGTECPRGQHRKILNSRAPIYTGSIATYGITPSEKDLKTSQTAPPQQKRKWTLRWVGEAEILPVQWPPTRKDLTK